MTFCLSSEEPVFKEYLQKKLKKNTWKEYWVILKDQRLLFFNSNDAKFAGSIDLTQGTSCVVFGVRTRRKPGFWGFSSEKSECIKGGELNRIIEKDCLKFALKTKRGIHLFKASSAASCYNWVRIITHTVDEYVITDSLERTKLNSVGKTGLSSGNNSTLSLIPSTDFIYGDKNKEIEPHKKLERSKSMRETTKSGSFKRGRFHSLRIKMQHKYSALQEQ